ncbi:obtusifoliol 14-alpha demethylase-like [Lolium rigidum]|uniref:obtusifoliol 14-alpha demethylase-like n=1 Tax=Lolium rigidum TaxID=89674 RepID=UPI001F5C48BF|nr:obtusifoliol 14-alpha demethylase-like [Lolium rigidum]
MEMPISALWFTMALFLITLVLTRIANRRNTVDDVCTLPPPPEVKGIALMGLFPTLFTKGPEATMHYLYNKLGSAFTVRFLWKRTTFLVGQEASGVFFQGLESEVTQGNLFEFTVPMFGRDMGFAVDYATRMEQTRFFVESLRPAQLRSYVDPMLQEVENYFEKWGEQGVVDLKYEFEELLMLISSRCLVGKEVREKMFGQFCTLFHEIEEGVNFASFMFPYIPIPVNRRRDRARIRLTGILSEVVRSRKIFNRVEDDVLQRFIDSTYKGGRGTTVEEVSGMMLGLIFAGKHTSAMTTTWTGACLLSHPKYFDAALEEQKQIIIKYNGKIDYNILSEMVTLHSCIKEAARLHPALPTLVRQVKKDTTVRTKEGCEYVIPRGDTLVNLVMVNNMLTHIYKDPKVYDPDRFRPAREEDKAGGKFSYTSFGGGRHACGGEAYAYMQIKIIFSHLLRNFELKLISSFPKPDWSKFLPEPKGKVMVSYKRCHLPST